MQEGYIVKFFKYFIDDKKTFFKYAFLSFIVGVLELVGVALTYPFINRILTQNGDSKAFFIGFLIIGVFLVKNLFMIFYNSLQASFIKSAEASINKKFMYYFINGDYQNLSRISLPQKQQILGFLTPNSINNFLLRILNLNVNIFIFVLITGFLFVKFFTATIITLICSLVLLFMESAYFKYKTNCISKKINEANIRLSQASNNVLLNLKSIKIQNSEEHFWNNYCEKLRTFTEISRELLFYNSIPPYITEPFIIILLLILLSIISIQNASNTSTLVASYALIVSAIFRLAPTISRIQVNITGINNSIPQVKEIINYYEKFSLMSFEPDNSEPTEFNNSIELKNVSFSYDEKLVLKDINLKINKGDFIGIAGSSGAGKTTLVDIIAGLLRIKSGEIYIDNKFINTNKMPRLKIGYIPQEYSVIPMSFRENVALGEENINDDIVIESLKKAQLYDFIIENYKEGIYANPFVDSTGLSLGQKQRLAIARALYLNPDIIILDEATSSLDLKTEDEICDVLNKLKGEKTIIAIAHRLSTIKNASNIIFLKNQTITDIGTFADLTLRNSDFHELVKLNSTDSIH